MMSPAPPSNLIDVTQLGDADVPVLVQQVETSHLEAVASAGAVANPV